MSEQVPEDRLPLADHSLTARRLEKLEELRREGIDPYPVRFSREATVAEVRERQRGLAPGEETGERVSLAGRLMAYRAHGRLSFGELQDGSGPGGAARIQLLVSADALGEDRYERFARLDLGDWVGVGGEVMATRRGELSVRVEEFVLLAKALRPLPEKWHGLKDVDQRFRRRYLDLLMNEEARRIALARIRVVAELRRQFEARGFVEVETPILQAEAGGAVARPFVTHHHALDQDMYLRIATELHLKRLVVGGMERVYELGRIFRNEGMDRAHNPEFTTLEAYQAYADYHDIMELVEEVVAAVAEAVTGGTTISYQGETIDLAPPYRRVGMVDLVADALGEPVRFDREELAERARRSGIEPHPEWRPGRLVAELFEELVAPRIRQPTFVMDHPKEVSPLARAHRRDPRLVERFELYVAGGEYCDAFSELNDPLEQRRRFVEQAGLRAAAEGEVHPIDEDFLRALEFGLPPTGGLGIGVDRLTMLLTDQANIREVILFPHMRREGEDP